MGKPIHVWLNRVRERESLGNQANSTQLLSSDSKVTMLIKTACKEQMISWGMNSANGLMIFHNMRISDQMMS